MTVDHGSSAPFSQLGGSITGFGLQFFESDAAGVMEAELVCSHESEPQSAVSTGCGVDFVEVYADPRIAERAAVRTSAELPVEYPSVQIAALVDQQSAGLSQWGPCALASFQVSAHNGLPFYSYKVNELGVVVLDCDRPAHSVPVPVSNFGLRVLQYPGGPADQAPVSACPPFPGSSVCMELLDPQTGLPLPALWGVSYDTGTLN